MNFDDFSRANRARCEARDGFNHALDAWTLSDCMTATMGELGEAANVAKKLNRYRDGISGNKESETALREKLKREIADTFIYLDLMAQAAGFKLSEAVAITFDEKSIELGSPHRVGGVSGAFSVGEIARYNTDPTALMKIVTFSGSRAYGDDPWGAAVGAERNSLSFPTSEDMETWRSKQRPAP